jgi:hypothetical protein
MCAPACPGASIGETIVVTFEFRDLAAISVKRPQAALGRELPRPFASSRLILRRLIPGVRRAEVSGKVFVAL